MPRSLLMLSVVVAAALFTSALPASAQPLTFENDAFAFVLGDDGRALSLKDKPGGQERFAASPSAFAWVRKGGKTYAASAVARTAEGLRVAFGESGVEADYAVEVRPRYLVFTLAAVRGEGVEEFCLAQVTPAAEKHRGWWLNVQWDEAYAVCLMGLSDSVNTGGMRALVYPEFGMAGRRAALVAAPTPQLMDVVRQMEADQGLPSPTIDGHWAKRSPMARRGYLFLDMTEANVDEVIRYARLGEFGTVMLYDGTWATSLGSYPINTGNYPGGEDGLKATVARLHAAGLKAGLHMLTSFVGKNDPLVRPKPDPRLLKDGETTLAADIDAKATEIPATGSLDGFPTEGAFYGDGRQGQTLVIDDEIVHYRETGGPDGRTLLGCTRGFAGTTAAPHKAGASIAHLCERYGCYLADLRTDLKDAIADRVAGVINRCGFDMIYFDGGECNMANGPYWYWVSQQQMAVWQRVRRDLFVQGSGGTPWTWHVFSRGCCDDFAAVAPKPYLDYHKIADSWRHYTDSFMPAELGWWGFMDATSDHPATRPDEVECYAARMIALDTPVSLETHVAALKKNGRTDELLALLGEYERLRLAGAFPPAVREALRTGEWHLTREGEKRTLRPVRYDVRRVAVPADVVVTNGHAAQPLKFIIEAVPALASPGDAGNVVLLAVPSPMPLPPPQEKVPMPGAPAGRVAFDKPVGRQAEGFVLPEAAQVAGGKEGQTLDLLHHRALAVTLLVEAEEGAAASDAPPAVLNVQLEATAKRYRDYYIDLDFTGERTVILPEPTTERMLPEFRPAHGNYAFKAAMYGYDYGHIAGLNFRWMRWPGGRRVRCSVVRVEALAEKDLPVAGLALETGGVRFALPGELKTGDYAECWADGQVRVFDANGHTLATHPAGGLPQLVGGENRLRLIGPAGAPVKLTVITLGDPVWP
jgi:hypothetical protein